MDKSYISVIFVFLILGTLIYLVHKILLIFKLPKIGSMCLISGGVKTGKTTFAVALSNFEYKMAHFRWRISKTLCRWFDKEEPEEPLLYSNIPLAIPYVPLTKAIIERQERVRYKSIIYVCEASLLADSQTYRDMSLNDRLLLFNKLIGHSTRGGKIIYDTQTIADCHMGIKRCLSEYFYIHHLVKSIPFFLCAYIREDRYSYDGSVSSSYDGDVEDSLTRVLIPKKVWKLFDCYCYSSLTDDLPVNDNVVVADSLKADKIISFKDWDKYIHKPSNKKNEVKLNEEKND